MPAPWCSQNGPEVAYRGRVWLPLFFILSAENPQVFSLRDVRRYPCCLMYSLMVLGLASPIEQEKIGLS